jgi:hypothetical protein
MRHAVGALLLTALALGHAHAQTPEGNATLAEQLFNQGRDLVKANQWADACPKFEASLRYDPVLGTRLNLATCYEHVGKLASAWGLYRESIELARKAGDTKRAEYAQKQATALEPRLPKLAISAPANAPAGLAVKRDDTPVDAGALGVALYVDPGTHSVTASAPGFESAKLSVTVTEGKTETVAIPALVARPVPAAVAKKASEPSEETPVDTAPVPRSPRRRYLALGLGGAGVVAIGVGLVFGAKASSKWSDARKLCGDDLVCSDPASFNQSKKLVSDGRSAGNVATGLVIGGLAAGAAGAVVWFWPRSAERTTAHLVPVPHDGGAGLALTGVF